MPAIVLRDRKESRVLMPLKMKPVSAVWALRDILGGGHRLVDDQWRVVFGQGASNGIRIRPPNVFFPPTLPCSDSHDMPLDFVCLHFDSLLTLC